MNTHSTPKIKVCCISSIEEAKLAIACGASALGFVSHMPSGPGVIAEDLIADIISKVPACIETFLLTSKTNIDDIILQQKFCRASTIQIVDTLTTGTYVDLRHALPGISLVQVIHVTGEESVGEAIEVSTQVDAILLDSGNPNLTVKELGGTGRVHDWTISRRIKDSIRVPLYLAGGLNACNVQQAVRAVQPYGVDVCSGVRVNGRLDRDNLRKFIKATEN